MSFEVLAFLFILAMFLGLELISKVPSTLHTPLMSGANAISGITLVGALILAGADHGSTLALALASFAVGFAAINVIGGYMVTDRMLEMFKSKQVKAKQDTAAPNDVKPNEAKRGSDARKVQQ